MKYFLLIISIYISLGLNAQANTKKNQVKLGVPGAYFFDDESYRFHSMKDIIYLPTYISYSRKINSFSSLSLNYNYLWLPYNHDSRLFEKNEIMRRSFAIICFQLNLNFKIKKKINPYFSLGAVYRFYGGELFHLGYINHGHWREAFVDSRGYNDFGISFTSGINYSFYKNFNVGTEIGFTRYFSKISPNMLSTTIFFGYNF
ncbi:MAG: hypothetical protein ACM3PT_13605 [Deltaproteobacteria bacterium]